MALSTQRNKTEEELLLELLDTLPTEHRQQTKLESEGEYRPPKNTKSYADCELFVSEYGLKPGSNMVSLKTLHQIYIHWSEAPEKYRRLCATLDRYFRKVKRANRVHYLLEGQDIKKSKDELMKEIGIRMYERKKKN